MRIDRTTLLFFDASCLMAAARSPSGGSGFLLSLCARGLLQGAVSQPVLLEAERNIAGKMEAVDLAAFHRLLALTPLSLAPLPPSQAMQSLSHIVNPKDVHVVAAAQEVEAPFLITLDRGLAAEVNEADLPMQALTPGDYIKTVLPHHVDFSLESR